MSGGCEDTRPAIEDWGLLVKDINVTQRSVNLVVCEVGCDKEKDKRVISITVKVVVSREISVYRKRNKFLIA